MEQTPLGSVRLSGIAYRKIEELEIIEKAGMHGKCVLIISVDESFSEQDVLRLEQQSIMVSADDKVIFYGVVVTCQLTSQAEEKRLQLVLYSQSYLLDIGKKYTYPGGVMEAVINPVPKGEYIVTENILRGD